MEPEKRTERTLIHRHVPFVLGLQPDIYHSVSKRTIEAVEVVMKGIYVYERAV
jgi:hypothetical protein